MRPNVMQGGSFAGGPQSSSAVRAFSNARMANVEAMAELMGRGVADAARAKSMFTQASRQAFTKAQVGQFLGRGQTFGAPPPVSRARDNTETFGAIGGALREVLGLNRSDSSSSQRATPSPVTQWRPRGDDGWGDTPLGARGSNESMVSKAIAGFSFL